MTHSLSVTHARPSSFLAGLKEVLLVVGASILIGLTAQIAIPLPFTPIPVAFHPQVILFLALTMGAKRASCAVLLYLIEGALGLPVFALGKSGVTALLGATGGYLMSYPLAAYVTGWFAERFKRKGRGSLFIAMAVGNAIVLVAGAAWLSCFVGWSSAFLMGILPFVAGDLIKLVSTSFLMPARFLTRHNE